VKKSLTADQVSLIVERSSNGSPPTLTEIAALLRLTSKAATEALFEGARKLREIYFGNRVFLYGFIYLSTYCRNNCAFCHWRTELTTLSRYRKTADEIYGAAIELAAAGVSLIDLTMGEDPQLLTPDGFELLCQTAAKIGQQTQLPIMLSPGVLSQTQLSMARRAGVTWYALYQETHNRNLFKAWRRGQDFEKRMKSKKKAAAMGFLVEEGVLLGAGATPEDLADSIVAMGKLGATQLRAMAYVPSPGGLPPDYRVKASNQELLMIAVLRLSYPRALIPASLDVEGLQGLAPRLSAGANVVTSLVPAYLGLAGVAHQALDIENHNRGVEKVSEILTSNDLSVGQPQEYQELLRQMKRNNHL
jgi:methylornithine synthase